MKYAKLKKIFAANPDCEPWIWEHIVSPGTLYFWSCWGDEKFFQRITEKDLRNIFKDACVEYIVFRDISVLLDEPLPKTTRSSIPILQDIQDVMVPGKNPWLERSVTEETFHRRHHFVEGGDRRNRSWVYTLTQDRAGAGTFREALNDSKWHTHPGLHYIVKRKREWNIFAERFVNMSLEIYRIPNNL